MIYLLLGIFVGILIACLWEVMHFHKNTKHDFKLGEYNTQERREKIFKKVENEGNTKKSN